MTKSGYGRWAESSWYSDQKWQAADIISCGIDVGSVSSQAVILADEQLFAYSSVRTGSNSPDSARRALDAALTGTGLALEKINYIIGTGYGRVNVPFAGSTITEISCHARGAHHLVPSARTILDMGGQDCKVIRNNPLGKVTQFVTNDKCAAGTGRGLEVFAELFAVPIAEVGRLSLDVAETPQISSTCVIFAKSEAINLLNQGWDKNQVLAAYCSAMAVRVCRLINRLGLVEDFVITGGIAKNIGIVKRIEDMLHVKAIPVKPDSQIAGALGAALYARDFFLKEKTRRPK
jgi:bzd-type benzoyl-CoA reductase Q subunit